MSASAGIGPDIERANLEFEGAWATVLEVSRLMGTEQDVSFASHRLLSFNPQNEIVMQTNKNLSNAVNVICNFTARKIEEVNKNHNDVTSWSSLAKCYLMLNDYPNAFTSVAHVIRINENYADPVFWFVAGIVYQHFQYNEKALKFYKTSLRQDANSPYLGDLNFRLAILYRSLENYDEAIPLFRQALNNPPRNLTEDDIRFQIAFTLQLQGSPQANAEYNDLYKRHPNSLEVVQQYAWYLSLSSDPRSLASAENLAESNPMFANDPVLKFVLARIALKQQDTSVAYQRYRESLTTWSDSPLFWCGLGVLYFKNEQYQDAIVAFQRALFLKSDITEAWLNFGLIFQRKGKVDSAIKIYQTALTNCNNSSLIQERINALQAIRNTQGKTVNYDICEINGNKLFVQIAEKVGIDYCADLPLLPTKAFGVPREEAAAFELALPPLAVPHSSIF